jgi:hypothetical protein
VAVPIVLFAVLIAQLLRHRWFGDREQIAFVHPKGPLRVHGGDRIGATRLHDGAVECSPDLPNEIPRRSASSRLLWPGVALILAFENASFQLLEMVKLFRAPHGTGHFMLIWAEQTK